jgi:hypothetical protein
MSEGINDQLILIGGFSAGGKSASLRNIEGQNRWMYLNSEAGKRLHSKMNSKIIGSLILIRFMKLSIMPLLIQMSMMALFSTVLLS